MNVVYPIIVNVLCLLVPRQNLWELHSLTARVVTQQNRITAPTPTTASHQLDVMRS